MIDENICFKAVIFDMDGTLIDSVNADFLAWQKVFADYNKSLTFKDYMPLLGMRSFSVVEQFFNPENAEEQKKVLTKKSNYFREIIEENGIELIPYAQEFIKHLKENNVPLALATSSRRAKMEMVMDKVGLLSYFDVTVTAEDVVHGKPAPDIFIKAASLLDEAAGDCLVFEDTVNGINAAKGASMKCVALDSNDTPDLLNEADVVIESFKDLDFTGLCAQLIKNNNSRQ